MPFVGCLPKAASELTRKTTSTVGNVDCGMSKEYPFPCGRPSHSIKRMGAIVKNAGEESEVSSVRQLIRDECEVHMRYATPRQKSCNPTLLNESNVNSERSIF